MALARAGDPAIATRPLLSAEDLESGASHADAARRRASSRGRDRRARPHDRRGDVAVRRRVAAGDGRDASPAEDDPRARSPTGSPSTSETLIPLVGPTMDYVYRLHLREQLRHAAFAAGDRAAAGARRRCSTIGFADLVGFTELGEELPPEEIGQVTGRLDEISREVATGPVRLVKLIGDAAMLAAPDTRACSRRCTSCSRGWATRGEDGYPLIRAGVACGPVRHAAAATTTAHRSTSPAGSRGSPAPGACSSPTRCGSRWRTATASPRRPQAPEGNPRHGPAVSLPASSRRTTARGRAAGAAGAACRRSRRALAAALRAGAVEARVRAAPILSCERARPTSAGAATTTAESGSELRVSPWRAARWANARRRTP